MDVAVESEASAGVLDARWYAIFKKIGSFQAYEYLNGDKTLRAEQREKFMNGEIEDPALDYPNIDQAKLREDEDALLNLKRDIIANEPNEIVKQAYRWKINEKLAEVRLLRAAANGDMNRFRRYSEFIYGNPSLEVFIYTVDRLKQTIGPHLSSDDPVIQAAAKELNDLLPSDLPAVTMQEILNQTSFAVASAKTRQELGDLLNIGPLRDAKTSYEAQEISDIFEQALRSLNADGWKVVLDTGSSTAISVNQERKAVKIPESKQLDYKKLQKLLAHEVGTHVERRLSGERSKLLLLGLGLDRYEGGEEGIATMREQVLEDKIEDFSGVVGHLAISLAQGLDGTPRDFRRVYEIMKKYFYFKELTEGRSKDPALESAQTRAWNTTVRTFRGTGCTTAGICFSKDIIYREGNMGIWDIIRQNPDEMIRFNIGKYDPRKFRHFLVLHLLGITDEDLDLLERDPLEHPEVDYGLPESFKLYGPEQVDEVY